MAPCGYYRCYVSLTTELAIVYVAVALVTAFYAIRLAFEGEIPYKQMPEQYRNRRWVKPFLPIIFIILPALLWPIFMLSIVIMVVVCNILANRDEAKREKELSKNTIDIELGLESHAGLVSRHHSSKLTSFKIEPSETVAMACDELTPLLPKKEIGR